MAPVTDRWPSREAALLAYFKSLESESGLKGFLAKLFVTGMLLLVGASIFFSGSSTFTAGCSLFFLIPGAVLGLWAIGGFSSARRRLLLQLAERAGGPEDEEVQAFIDRGVDLVKRQALATLGASEEDLESELLTVIAPFWDEAAETTESRATLHRQGDDGLLRFSSYRVAVIALTERRLGLFSCEYDLIADRIVDFESHEYHYTDIVAVSTGQRSTQLQFPSGERSPIVEEFRVSVPNGEAIRISVDSADIRRVAGPGSLPASGAEKAVRAIRAQLRRKVSA